MSTSTSDNFNKQSFNNPYGNQAVRVASISAMTTQVLGDQIELMRLPAGAFVTGGHICVGTAVATATICVGVRYADGTSTGGTTGTDVLGTGVPLTTARAPQFLNFVPFTNDADTIVYATQVGAGGAAPGANIKFAAVVKYESTGSK